MSDADQLIAEAEAFTWLNHWATGHPYPPVVASGLHAEIAGTDDGAVFAAVEWLGQDGESARVAFTHDQLEDTIRELIAVHHRMHRL